MTFEQFLVLMLVVLVPLLRVVARVLRQQPERERPREVERPRAGLPPRARMPVPRAAEEVPAEPLSRRVPAKAEPPPPRRRPRAARWKLGDARRGIILMTVLGPCRALEPPPRQDPVRR